MRPLEGIMNVPSKALAAAIVLLIVAPIALAQDGPKLYRWVGPDGKVHYSDDLPPEALDQARQELSSKNGMALKQVDRAQTAEERTAAQSKADADAKAAEAIAKSKQNDQVLLSSYSTEADLKRAYEQRIVIQNETLKTTQIGLKSQRQALSSLLIEASNLELTGKPVTAQLAKSIQTTHADLLDQQQSEMQAKAQVENLRNESGSAIEHYRSVRAAAEASRAATAPAVAAPPKG
jgi:hypothetical protein